jgi:methyltransferase family protein
MSFYRPAVDSEEIASFDADRKFRALRRIYAFHHTRRFEWLKHKLSALGKQNVSILELGCNDARSLNYVPLRVHRYLGFDAGWRSGWKNGRPHGLEAARVRFRNRPAFEFRSSTRHEDLFDVDEQFDVAIVLETLEYLDPAQLESYVFLLSEKLKDDGLILCTMPNEKGLPLLLKVIGSKLSGVRRSEYTLPQFWNALLGRLDRVPRSSRGRKGFDYAATARMLRRHFAQVSLEPVEPPNFPLWLSLNVGLVGSKQPRRPEPSGPTQEGVL